MAMQRESGDSRQEVASETPRSQEHGDKNDEVGEPVENQPVVQSC